MMTSSIDDVHDRGEEGFVWPYFYYYSRGIVVEEVLHRGEELDGMADIAHL